MAKIVCDPLWSRVVALSQSNGGDAVRLPGTRAVVYPNKKNWNIIHLKINTKWGLPKEDFLHFIATGSALMGRKGERLDKCASPSMTRQEPYVQSIVMALGGENNPEITAVRRIQQDNSAYLG
jgi:hypothetical protein